MVTLENYEEYMLLEADGELAEAEQKELYAFLDQHPELKNELALYKATIMEPDASVVYEHKEQLLKQLPGGKRTIALGGWWTYGAVAACLAMVLFLLLKPQHTIDTPVVATTQHTHTNINATAPQKAQPVQQELHSIPTNPITKETAEKQQPQAIAKSKKQPVIQQVKQSLPTPAEQAQQDELPIAKRQVPVSNMQTDLPKPKTEVHTELPAITDSQTETLAAKEDREPKENHRLLALLPEDKREGISIIASAVNEKIEKVKNIKNKIKDTDISFRFGNRELFVVKL